MNTKEILTSKETCITVQKVSDPHVTEADLFC